jgi:hypothetical protein
LPDGDPATKEFSNIGLFASRKGIVLFGVKRLPTKDNCPAGQAGRSEEAQLIVVIGRLLHKIDGYLRSIPPKLPRTTRIVRTTAL